MSSNGPTWDDKYITTWFRHSFHVADASAVMGLALGLVRDDGAVVYLNGVELARSNMPAGAITYQSLAASTVSNTHEDSFHPFFLEPGALVSGNNVLAVEVGAQSVDFFVNGAKVATVPRAGLATDGIVGLRVNHALNVHVSAITVTPK